MIRIAIAALVLAGCAMVGPTVEGGPPHHATAGFRNVPPTRGLDAADFIADRARIAIEAINGPPRAPPLTRAQARDAWRALGSRDALQWIGHATVLIRIAGTTVIVDPVFAARVTPLPPFGPRRNREATVAREDLPPLDVVLITHDHYDHFEPETIRALAARGPIHCLAPLGVRLDDLGCTHVAALDWHQARRIGALDLTLLPAQHDSGRGVLDRDRTLWGSWLIAGAGRRVYVAGDTGYGPHFAAIGARHGPIDWALINLGGFLPRALNRDLHLDLDEALQAAGDLRARRIVPLHWGTYALGREDTDATGPALLARARDRGPDVVVLRLGESLGL